MYRDARTNAPVLNKAEARQAKRVGLIWVLAGSLALAVLVALALSLSY